MSATSDSPGNRVHIFVDFWNFELSIQNTLGADFRIDWFGLGHLLTEQTVRVVNPATPLEYQGMRVYGSYDPNSPNEQNLRRWALNTLPRAPGVTVRMTERRRKATGPKCPSCRRVISHCMHCGGNMRGTEEKGVDTAIATDMMRLAWDNNYDVAVLVSSDRDFIPVVQSLETKGIRVIHGAFPPQASELTKACWGSIGIPNISENFRRS